MSCDGSIISHWTFSRGPCRQTGSSRAGRRPGEVLGKMILSRIPEKNRSTAGKAPGSTLAVKDEIAESTQMILPLPLLVPFLLGVGWETGARVNAIPAQP